MSKVARKEVISTDVEEVQINRSSRTSKKRMQLDACLSAQAAVASIGNILQKEIERNDPYGPEENRLIRFHSLSIPRVSIGAYIQRLERHANFSPGCLVAGLIYLQRLANAQHIRLNSYNIHRLYFTATVVATKFLDDIYFHNAFYARIGGVGLRELNQMEIDFLYMVGFRLYVSTTEYEMVELDIQREAALLGCESAFHDGLDVQPVVAKRSKTKPTETADTAAVKSTAHVPIPYQGVAVQQWMYAY